MRLIWAALLALLIAPRQASGRIRYRVLPTPTVSKTSDLEPAPQLPDEGAPRSNAAPNEPGSPTDIPDGESQTRADEQPALEPDRTTTIDDARGTFQTLVETWLRANKSGDGLVRLTDPDTRKTLPLAFVKVDPRTLRETTPGVFVGDVALRGPRGAAVTARATMDLSTSDWTISRLELPSRKRLRAAARKPRAAAMKPDAAATPDASRLFVAAVMDHVRAAVARDGAFIFDDGRKKRRLTLKSLSSSDITAIDATHSRGVGRFTDLEDRSAVSVEFFVSLSSGAGRVYRTASPDAGR